MNPDTPTPTTDTYAVLMMLIAEGGQLGEITAHILAGMYPDPVSITN